MTTSDPSALVPGSRAAMLQGCICHLDKLGTAVRTVIVHGCPLHANKPFPPARVHFDPEPAWTTDPPTKPGLYRNREASGLPETIVRIDAGCPEHSEPAKRLAVFIDGSDVPCCLEESAIPGEEWAGPLEATQ